MPSLRPVPDKKTKKKPVILVIAGSDSCGGAGVLADMRTLSGLGAYGMGAITAVTAQTPFAVEAIEMTSPSLLAAQMRTAAQTFPLHAIKIGLLGNEQLVGEVAAFLKELDPLPFVVLDPVLVSSSGAQLAEEASTRSLITMLAPYTGIVTPNREETHSMIKAMQFEDMSVRGAFATMGFANVLCKNYKSNEETCTDLLIEGIREVEFTHKRIDLKKDPAHGTGCALSSALAVYRAKGSNLRQSVKKAIAFVEKSMEQRFRYNGRKGVAIDQLWPLNEE